MGRTQRISRYYRDEYEDDDDFADEEVTLVPSDDEPSADSALIRADRDARDRAETETPDDRA